MWFWMEKPNTNGFGKYQLHCSKFQNAFFKHFVEETIQLFWNGIFLIAVAEPS
jgi:hypothetical protein